MPALKSDVLVGQLQWETASRSFAADAWQKPQQKKIIRRLESQPYASTSEYITLIRLSIRQAGYKRLVPAAVAV